MSIDFHRLIEAINNNRLIIIDYIDYIDCLPMIDFHRFGTPGIFAIYIQHQTEAAALKDVSVSINKYFYSSPS